MRYQADCVHVPVKGDETLIIVELVAVNLLRVTLCSDSVLNLIQMGEILVYPVFNPKATAAERNKFLVGFQLDRPLTLF